MNLREPVMEAAAESFDQPPTELGADRVASHEWQRLAPILRKSKTVTEADRGALIALCQQWSRYLEANGSVASAGMVVRSPSGYPMPNPYIAISNRALAACVKLWAEMGLTPSARTRVHALEDIQENDPLESYIGPRLVG